MQEPKASSLWELAMGLNKNDSAPYYMERSIELAVQAGDTSKIVHYLRNYAQMQAYLLMNLPVR